MKYHEIIRALSEPLLITPAAHASLFKLFEEHRTLSSAEFYSKREGMDMCGNAVELEQAEVVNGVGRIPIAGPIGYGLGAFEKGAGAVDVADITEDIDKMEDDEECRSILFDIDSPGGMVTGTPELADRIAACRKPTYAFTSGAMCSAAYWLGSSVSHGIYATKSADVGSIGVYIPVIDASKRMEKEGYSIDVIASGKYKGMGAYGLPLTEEQRALLSERVNAIADMFYSHVIGQRWGVSSESMQGQTFMGEAALKAKLVDFIVSGIEDVPA